MRRKRLSEVIRALEYEINSGKKYKKGKEGISLVVQEIEIDLLAQVEDSFGAEGNTEITIITDNLDNLKVSQKADYHHIRVKLKPALNTGLSNDKIESSWAKISDVD